MENNVLSKSLTNESTYSLYYYKVSYFCPFLHVFTVEKYDSEDDYCTGCRNISHCQQQQSYLGLRSTGQSYSPHLGNDSWVQTLHNFRKIITLFTGIIDLHFTSNASTFDKKIQLTALMSMSVIPTLVVTTCVTPMAVLPSMPCRQK